MPTYEYLCLTCGKKFEIFHGMTDEPVKNCVDCGSSVKRLITGGSGFIMKGGNDSFQLPACGQDSPCCAMDAPCGCHNGCHGH